MNIFLESYILSNVIHEDTKVMNNPVPRKKIETVIKILATKKRPGPYGLTAEFYQKIKIIKSKILY